MLLQLLLLTVSSACAATVTISNVEERRDTNGDIMDAHDGNIISRNGLYYYYAASYGNCKEPGGDSGCSGMAPGSCGFQYNHNVSLFTSPDLSTWTNHGPVFQFSASGLQGILFCPKVLYNAVNNNYVLWFNWIQEPQGWTASWYGVATSSSPTGPFTVVVSQVTSLAYNDTGDFNLFQDDDGQGYIIYTSHISGYPVMHQMSVEKLTKDYLGTVGMTGNSGYFGASNVEAPALFKRNSVYYAVFGACCCYCQSGSPVVVYTASSPLGPYATQNNIGGFREECGAGMRSSIQSLLLSSNRNDQHCAMRHGAGASIPAQQTDIFSYQSTDGLHYLWVGDRWQSAPDGIKGHDLSYFSPLAFLPDGNITVMNWMDNFTINVLPPSAP